MKVKKNQTKTETDKKKKIQNSIYFTVETVTSSTVLEIGSLATNNFSEIRHGTILRLSGVLLSNYRLIVAVKICSTTAVYFNKN